MPYLRRVKDQVDRTGELQLLDDLEFDEFEFLKTQSNYMKAALSSSGNGQASNGDDDWISINVIGGVGSAILPGQPRIRVEMPKD
jgi:hypothetical protein